MARSKSSVSGLLFPVARILRYMRHSHTLRRRRIRSTAGVYLTAVLEYLTKELVELAGDVTRKANKKLLTPRNILLAVANDEELHQCLRSVILPYSGIVPAINQFLLRMPTRPSPRPKSRSPGLPKTSKRVSPLAILWQTRIARQTSLCVVRGSVTTAKGDAVVHPTNASCGFHGQVGSALLNAGGAALQTAVNNALVGLPPLEHCGVRLTPAAGIGYSHILHCNSPMFNSNDIARSTAELTDAVQRCLAVCDQNNLRELVLPSIGSGGCNFPKQLAAHTIVRAIKTYCDSNFDTTNLSSVTFVLYDQASIDVYVHELGQLQ